MKAKEAAEIIKGIEEVRGVLPEDGLLVEEALSMAIKTLELFGNSEQLPSAQPEPRSEPEKGDRQALIDTTPEGVTPKLLTNHEAIKILRSIAKIAKPFMRDHLKHATAIALDKAESALVFAEVMSRSHTCNNCGQKDCGYKPEWGEQVRYNCFWWKEGNHEGDL